MVLAESNCTRFKAWTRPRLSDVSLAANLRPTLSKLRDHSGWKLHEPTEEVYSSTKKSKVNTTVLNLHEFQGPLCLALGMLTSLLASCSLKDHYQLLLQKSQKQTSNLPTWIVHLYENPVWRLLVASNALRNDWTFGSQLILEGLSPSSSLHFAPGQLLQLMLQLRALPWSTPDFRSCKAFSRSSYSQKLIPKCLPSRALQGLPGRLRYHEKRRSGLFSPQIWA